MQILHRGFDTITLAIQANISKELFDYLEAEKDCAENTRNPVPIFYNGESPELPPQGGHGYRFILKGGPLHPIWFFKKPNSRDPWGIRIPIGSTLLATQGLAALSITPLSSQSFLMLPLGTGFFFRHNCRSPAAALKRPRNNGGGHHDWQFS